MDNLTSNGTLITLACQLHCYLVRSMFPFPVIVKHSHIYIRMYVYGHCVCVSAKIYK